jgi:hypothetical protein
MELRWLVVIALWTILSGPAFHTPGGAARSARDGVSSARTSTSHGKAAPRAHAVRPVRP